MNSVSASALRPLPDEWDQTAVAGDAEALIIDIDGFEGPLDLLLTLSRQQKVDLRKISILQLAEQYLSFIADMQRLRIELAADYLVMAAWLAYLKSRLLLPRQPDNDGPSADELAADLAFRLERLQAIREGAARLMTRDRLGYDIFARGQPEDISLHRHLRYQASLVDMLRAYARVRARDDFRPFVLDRKDLHTMEQALERLRHLIAHAGDWADLVTFLPKGWGKSSMTRRSSVAASFVAVLELARQGELDLRQGKTFAPIEIRRRQ